MFVDSDVHHHHDSLVDSIANIVLQQRSPSSSSSTSQPPSRLFARSSTSCTAATEFGKCALPTQSQTLPIALGVTIPLVGAICVLVYLHFRHLKKLKMEEIADKHIDIDMDDYDTTLNNSSTLVPEVEKFNRYPEQSHRGSMETGNSLNPDNPFYARAPYMMHPELSTSKHSLDEYSRSLHSMMDSNIYPSNASIYSSNSGGAGGIARPLSPKYPPSIAAVQRHPSSALAISPPQPRISASSEESYLSSDRTEKGTSTISPPSTVLAYSPDMNSHPMDQHKSIQENLEKQIISSLPTPPERSYQRDSILTDDNDLSRDSMRFSKDFRARVVSEAGSDVSFKETEKNPKIELDRSATKQFERVKSFYREYLPESPTASPEVKPVEENSEVPEIDPFKGQSLDQVVEEEKHQHEYQEEEKALPGVPEQSNNYQHSDYPDYPEYPQHPNYPEDQEYQQHPDYQHQQDHQQHDEHEQHLHQETDQYDPSEYQQYNQQQYSQDYEQYSQQYSQQDPQQHHQHQSQNVYYPDYPTSPPFSPNGSNGKVTPSFHRAFAGSPAPSLSVTPLADLTQLPVPHNLDENDSPLAYAPQRRHNKGGAASPIPSYNPIIMNEEATALPSPHELRKSVALMTFTPPKKYVGAGSSASSSRAGSLTSASTGPGQAWIGPTPKARPSSQLVPDAKDTQMLRPQMNMR